MSKPFMNDDGRLSAEAARIVDQRRSAGLVNLVGGLEAVIIATEPDLLGLAVRELLETTGLAVRQVFEDEWSVTYVLGLAGCVDFVIRSRKAADTPFREANDFPVGRRLPSTRLETFVFKVDDLGRYVEIQRARGVEFLTPGPVAGNEWAFIQTPPSRFTGNSIGFVQWKGSSRDWSSKLAKPLDRRIEKPARPFLANIGRLDHCATRVRAEDRDPAILEFMNLTEYRFEFAIYVESLNSITNVSRLSPDDFALVFTSGIAPYVDDEASGPTEKFAHNYGPRVHHMAFVTERIEETVEGLASHGTRYLEPLCGSREEGLKQVFTVPSRSTLLVNEYIQRYDGFDGFFTRSNVTALTRATGRQD